MQFIDELKRRNVFRVGAAYAVTAWLLIQVAETVFPLFDLGDGPARIVVLVLALGFIPVVLFAWAFELTPEGVKKEKDVDRTQSITSQTGRKLDRMIIVVLALAVAYFAWDKFIATPGQPADEPSAGTEASAAAQTAGIPSVAVLPFVNMSSSQENEYFSDGLTETLLHILAQLPDLKVAARTSAFSFKGRNLDVREIGETLGVEHILEGSVQRSGERVRITAQLVRANDGFHVWSENFDRTLDDIFSIQDEIAERVANALRASLGGTSAPVHSLTTQNIDAYDLFLKGLSAQAVFSYGALGEAESLFKKALAADPEFVEAKLALAWNYYRQASTGLISEADATEKAGPLVAQAARAEPDLPLSRALVDIHAMWQAKQTFDVTAANAALENLFSLLEEYPNQSFALLTASAFLRNFNRFDEAERMLRKALKVDPLQSDLYNEYARVLLAQERIEEARQQIDRAIELAPERPNPYNTLAWYHRKNGDLAEAIRMYMTSARLDPEDPELTLQIASWLLQLDLPESARNWTDRTMAISPHSAAARLLQLEQAMHVGDDAATEALARKIVEDRIENRRGVVFIAMDALVKLNIERGTQDEIFTFLAETHPDALDFSKLPEDDNAGLAQFFLIQLRAMFDPEFDRVAAASNMRVLFEEKGVPIEEDDWFDAWLLAIAGDYETAAQILLEGKLAERFAEDPYILEILDESIWEPLKANPDVSHRVAELERDKQEQRALAIAMLESEGY